MSLKWAAIFESTVEHYACLAMTPGWWAYAQQQVISMETDPEQHGCWHGLRAAVGQRIKAAGFTPHPSEVANWWDMSSRLTPPRRARGG